ASRDLPGSPLRCPVDVARLVEVESAVKWTEPAPIAPAGMSKAVTCGEIAIGPRAGHRRRCPVFTPPWKKAPDAFQASPDFVAAILGKLVRSSGSPPARSEVLPARGDAGRSPGALAGLGRAGPRSDPRWAG